MFASKGSDFEKAATCEAKKIQLEMKALLEKYPIPIP
jgi:hypothetical protein